MIGEHGDSEMIPWSSVRIGGKDIYSVVRDNEARIGKNPYDEMKTDTIKAGWEIFNRKGNTCYGIASSTVGIVKTILHNENRILPVSTLLQGEYGHEDRSSIMSSRPRATPPRLLRCCAPRSTTTIL